MGDTRHEFQQLAGLYVPVAVVVFVLVCGAIAYCLVRFRAGRPGAPSRRSEHDRLEAGYAVLLAVAAAVLVGFTFHAEGKEDRIAAHPGLRIDVLAAQWNWRFSYPAQGIVRTGGSSGPVELVVPTNTTIEIDGRSSDVIHDFWVPELRFQRQLFPGATTRFDLLIEKPGTYGGLCAVYCGLLHSDMSFGVRALAPGAFAAWLRAGGPA